MTWSPSRWKILAADIRKHYGDVIMGAIASQITSLTIVYSTVYSDADQRKLQSSASLAFVRGIHRGPVNSPHILPVTRKMFLFDDVIMSSWTIICRFFQLKQPCTSSAPFLQPHLISDWRSHALRAEGNMPMFKPIRDSIRNLTCYGKDIWFLFVKFEVW